MIILLRPFMRLVLIFLAVCSFVPCGCRKPSEPQPKQTVIGWSPVASWSGNGNYQTDSFDIHTGQWRIKWQTSNQPLAKANTTKTKPKAFQVIVHSSVSGRFVTVAVDHPSAGSGIGYIAEDPRAFFLVVESSGLDWKLEVQEGSLAEQ